MRSRIRQTTFKQLNHGGKRRGAGRKPKGERAGVSHAKRPEIDPRHPLHVTLKIAPGIANLRLWTVLDLFHGIVQRVNAREGKPVQIVEFSIQRDHVHMIVEAESKEELSSTMNGLASSFARGINKLAKRSGDVFLDRYHSVAVDTPAATRYLLVYVLNNGRKHLTWTHACPDPFSSGRQFEGWSDWKGPQSTRWLPRARTWLLSVGWKKHGLISILESPKLRARTSPSGRSNRAVTRAERR